MRRRTLLAAPLAAPLVAPLTAPVVGALLAPTSAHAGAAPAKKGALEAELRALLDKQAAQWSAGDLDGFCAHYAEDAIFVSPSGRTDGRAAVLERYKKKYVDKAGMGTLTLEVLHVVAAGGTDATASIAMVWKLAFAGKPSAQGFSVIGLQKQAGAWKIVHDASM